MAFACTLKLIVPSVSSCNIPGWFKLDIFDIKPVSALFVTELK